MPTRLGSVLLSLALLFFAKPAIAQGVAETAGTCPATLRLERAPSEEEAGKPPLFRASITNAGDEPLLLVQPGDGSLDGWRTPLVEWLIEGPENPSAANEGPPVERCGNVNALKTDEVFTLAPGASMPLSGWTGQPFDLLPEPGTYTIRLRYVNDPTAKWEGLSLGEHDPGAMKQVTRSTPCALTSNPVQVVIE